MRFCFLLLFIMAVYTSAYAQSQIRGQLVDGRNDQPLSFAILELPQAKAFTTADASGQFSLEVNSEDTFELRIRAIGLDTMISVTAGNTQVITVFPKTAALDELEVKGYTAQAVVEEMLMHLEENYYQAGYAASAFYRQYHKINGMYGNLAEGKVVTLFQPGEDQGQPVMQQAHAVQSVRRSTMRHPLKGFKGDTYDLLFKKVLLYNLRGTSLDSRRFHDYQFWFDTAAPKELYVVHYRCPSYSTENHGVSNFTELNRKGEAKEEGYLVIDKESFALIEYERTALANPDYGYPTNDNYLIPHKEYSQEFVNALLKFSFQEVEGQMMLKRILYQHTNQYRHAKVRTVDYTITENFEWYAQHFSRYIDDTTIEKLQRKLDLLQQGFPYEPNKWNMELPPFYFGNSSKVHTDLQEFSKDGKVFRR